MEQEPEWINPEEAAEYIQDCLLLDGLAANREEILTVIEYYFTYLFERGFTSVDIHEVGEE